MADTYTEIYFHLIWTTKKREEMITPDVAEVLYPCLKAVCRDLGVTLHALNGMTDHIHLVCTLPTTLAVAELMQRLKGGSAHLINHLPGGTPALAWQPGYGALTFAGPDLKRVVAYVVGQQSHHQTGKLSAKMERTFTDRI